MQTLSELLATFPDPPKTLLNSKTPSSSSSPANFVRTATATLRSGHIPHHSHSRSNLTQSAGEPAAQPSSHVVSESLDMSMGIQMGGINSSISPTTPTSSIAAGGASAVAKGYKESDVTLLEKSCREEIDAVSLKEVITKLLSEPVLVAERALDIAYTSARNTIMKDLAAAKKKRIEKLEKDCPCSVAVCTNKHFLDFGSHPSLGQEVTDTLDITNNTGAKIKFRVIVPAQVSQLETEAYSLQILPREGLIKKKDVAHILFKLCARQPGQIGIVVIVAIEGGLRFHTVVKQEFFVR